MTVTIPLKSNVPRVLNASTVSGMSSSENEKWLAPKVKIH